MLRTAHGLRARLPRAAAAAAAGARLRGLAPHASAACPPRLAPLPPLRSVHTSSRAHSSAATSDSVATTHTSEKLMGAQRGLPAGVQKLLTTYASIPVERIRCFSIIAHIDHGKSTLADKLLELTKNIWPTVKGAQQVLDSLEVERQRGITVKAQSASMIYTHPVTGEEYLINLIDTPGHVDFSYEVARSLAACQGALLLIDAGQGVQAQTIANYNAAVAAGLKIIPVLTKIDLPAADPEPCLLAVESALGMRADDTLWTSAKTGAGIDDVLPTIIERIPPPGTQLARSAKLRCLLFDSWFDPYRGVVCAVLVVEGVIRPGDVIAACHSGDKFTVQEVGLMAPAKVPIPSMPGGGGSSSSSSSSSSSARNAVGSCVGGLGAGHMGYVIAGMKSTKQALVGDTFVHADAPVPPLPGFQPAKPMVFASLYPVDSGDFGALVTAVERLTLNDASVSIERESSSSLGFGLRCGFLGLLHMDVFHQRLQSEFSTPVIITAPMVCYRIQLLDGTDILAERPSDFPPAHTISTIHEPTVEVSIMSPAVFLSPLMGLLADRRGVQLDVIYLNQNQAYLAGTGVVGPGASPAAGSDAGSDASLSAEDAALLRAMEAEEAAAAAAEEAAAAAAAAEAEAEAEAEAGAESDEAGDDDDTDDDESGDDDAQDGGSGEWAGSSASSASTSLAVAGAAVNTSERVVLKYRLPWAEVVTNLYDAVKSMTAGYASLDWTPGDYQRADIVKVDVLLNAKPVDALSFVAHKSKALMDGRRVCNRLKTVIARQQFEIVIQAAMNGKVIARERIAPFRKDVLIKSGKTVGGGDRTRKMKLLAKQKEGKRRMKTVGNVELSQEAFHSLISK